MIRRYESGIAVAQRIKATLGITGLSPQEFTSTGRFGTSMSAHHPGAVAGSKGLAVRQLSGTRAGFRTS